MMCKKDINLRLSFISHEFPPIGGGASSALDAITKKLALREHLVQILTIGLSNKTYQEKDKFGRIIIRFGVGRKKILAPSAWELFNSYVALRYYTRPHLNKFKPDILTAFFAFPAGHAALILKNRLNVPLIVSLRGSDVPGFSNTRWGVFRYLRTFLLRPVWKHANLLITNGNNLLKLAEAFMQTGKIFNLPNGVDSETFHPHRESFIHGPLKILFVGQLIKRKRCLEMLEGIDWLAEKDNSAELTIVGEGPLRHEIELFTNRLKHKMNITLMGHVQRDKMPEIYRQHNVLIILSQAEGISNVLLEALASGLCIVASESASTDVLRDKEAGIVIDKVSSYAIGKALLTLAENQGTRIKMQKAARDLSESFDWNKTVNSFEEQVFKLLKKKSQPGMDLSNSKHL